MAFTSAQADRINKACPALKNALLGTAVQTLQTTVATLTSTAGAAAIPIADAGTYFATDNVEAALQSLGLSRSNLGLTTAGNGAALVGVEAHGTHLTEANVQLALEAHGAFKENLGLTTAANGASLVGVEAHGTHLTEANVQLALEAHGQFKENLGLTTAANGASLVGVETHGTHLTEANVQLALEAHGQFKENLGLTTAANGASLVGVESHGTHLTEANVQLALEAHGQFKENLGLSTGGNGASLVKIEAATGFVATDVQHALEELLARTYSGFYHTTTVAISEVNGAATKSLGLTVPAGKKVMIEGAFINGGANGWADDTGAATTFYIEDTAGVDGVTITKASLTDGADLQPWTAGVTFSAPSREGMTADAGLRLASNGATTGTDGAAPINDIVVTVWGRYI